MATEESNDIRKKDLLAEWAKRNLTALDAHYDAAKHFARKHYWLGIPAIILAAVVGTSVFASLEKEVNSTVKIIVASCSILSAVLTGLQTFLNYNQRSEKHRTTASQYSSVKREIEQLLTLSEQQLEQNDKIITTLREKIDSIGRDAPSLPVGYHEKSIKNNYNRKII
jgi:hypothetical protein